MTFSIGAMKATVLVWITTAAVIGLARPAFARDVHQVVLGLNDPLFATSPPGDTDRLFVVEREGRIRIVELASDNLLATPFLDISADVSSGFTQGILGMAFHPNYGTNGQFYLNYTDPAGDTVVARYEASGTNANLADATSKQTVLTIDRPVDSSHNGGWLGFSPSDGFLYVASGDGGGLHDPHGNGQNSHSLMGAMLRIDVDGDDFIDPNVNYAIPTGPGGNPFAAGGGAAEIWATGLRHPWRPSFDRLTGDLYIADVGEGSWEEINRQAAGAAGGQNYGWPLREGLGPTATGGVGGAPPVGNVDPIYVYPHGIGPLEGVSVTGGYVYRGPIAALQGEYFFGDFGTGSIWSIDVDTLALTNHTPNLNVDTGFLGNIASFGEDGAGNLYVVDLEGDVFMITNAPEPAAGSLAMLAAVACAGMARRWRRRGRQGR